MKIFIEKAKKKLLAHQLDGWLIYDYKKMNDVAHHFLAIPEETFITRRFFYWIPLKGEPVKIVHQIEPNILHHLPGETHLYLSWKELQERLLKVLKKSKKIAMEFSPYCHVPNLSKIDAGTFQMVRACNVQIESCSPFIQEFTSVLTPTQVDSHFEAMRFLEQTLDKTWVLIRQTPLTLTELDIQTFILDEMKQNGFVTEGKPIVASNQHSSDPHFASSKTKIKPGDLLLVDLWAKKAAPGSVFADITHMAILGRKPKTKEEEIFNIVKQARDAAFDLIMQRFEKGEGVKGYEVDEVCRALIQKHGYAEYFVHRTGHNIGQKLHDCGANIDSLETLDERPLVPNTCFSIEPGIYIPGEFGIRLETNVYIESTGRPVMTGNKQECLTLA